MTEESKFPKAESVLLTPINGVFRWKILECPYCKKEHVHGAGRDEDKVNTYLGHRIQHCNSGPGLGSGGYILVAKQD